MFKFLKRLRGQDIQRQTDAVSRTLEDSFKYTAQQLQSIEPETGKQWQRLKISLNREHGISSARQFVSQGGLLKPAISFAMATAVLIAIGVVWMRHSSIKLYETAKGQRSTITLQDSTEIKLNYLSELTVTKWPLEKARHVSLKGEAFFHVRRNGTPFILTTEAGTVQVLGTEFNVRVRDGRMEVAVLSGTVKLSGTGNGRDSSVILTKGQIALCATNDFPGIPGALPFPEYPGWMQGKFMFYKSSLFTACKEVESQFDVVIRIEKPQLCDVTLTGMMNGQSVEAALTTLVQLTGNKFRYEDGYYVIY
jgi:ferric-dicitrate binding protein FerR (iron transport regulator)